MVKLWRDVCNDDGGLVFLIVLVVIIRDTHDRNSLHSNCVGRDRQAIVSDFFVNGNRTSDVSSPEGVTYFQKTCGL